MSDTSTTDRLDSWKEIAVYLRRSVRTARRWEAREGLPVHRQMHRSQASVYAYRSEIDTWLRRSETEGLPTDSGAETRENGPADVDRSIAVLPFVYVGPEPSHEYLAVGFTDEVIGKLSKVKALRVISRTSSMALEGRDWDARTIGRRLEVRHLLEGTVREDRSRLKISVRLIDPQRDDRLWSDDYEGTLDDVFGIQEEIARRIVESLEVRLSIEEEGGLASPPERDVMAWQCVHQARQEALRWRRDAIDHAIRLLLNGIDTIGDDASLYAALGRVHLQYREAGIDLGPDPFDQAERCVAKVLELEPGSAAGYQLRGWLHYANGQVQHAVNDLRAAELRDDSQPDTIGLLANCYLISGQVEVARPLIERLLSIDPLTPLNRCLPGYADALQGRFENAVGPYREMLEMDPSNPLARLFLTWILTVNGRSDEVATLVADFPTEARGSLPERIAGVFARSLAGEKATNEPILDPESERIAASNDLFPRFLAQAYAVAGNRQLALRWLSTAVDRGFINYPYLSRHDPPLSKILRRPENEGFLRTIRERWQAFSPTIS